MASFFGEICYWLKGYIDKLKELRKEHLLHNSFFFFFEIIFFIVFLNPNYILNCECDDVIYIFDAYFLFLGLDLGRTLLVQLFVCVLVYLNESLLIVAEHVDITSVDVEPKRVTF